MLTTRTQQLLCEIPERVSRQGSAEDEESNSRLKHQNVEKSMLAGIERDSPRPCASDAQTALRRRHDSLPPQVGQDSQRPANTGPRPGRGETGSDRPSKLQSQLGSVEKEDSDCSEARFEVRPMGMDVCLAVSPSRYANGWNGVECYEAALACFG